MDKKNKQGEDQEKLSQMNKVLSPQKAIVKIIVAIIAFLWFLAGGSAQTVISISGGAIAINGIVSFFLRNPIAFMIIAVINVVLGFIFLLYSFFLAIFHFLWSIRWFYGYFRYRNLKLEDVI